ncbi:3-deoxy-manno-octulosonate cytidylyltransferase [Novosphingobium huizhouense]|uniref:3-deoxy-manno-octulosonate cytidylyltransferase n=1 Tax=Novosphingobium huizhouense TaxID=2866625 RepID=UPI001CD83835|nr:3-deoxy-manno-octulosonate cytidylyltransferase [Novosphingobium huizhouense]
MPAPADPRVLVVVPARFASSRFPGKPLALLRGADGAQRPLVERSWRAACRVSEAARVVIATDCDEIATCARGFGAEVVMTPQHCRNGTERCAAALAALGEEVEIVVNLQGDAPLTPPALVSALIGRMRADPTLPVCTPALPCTPTMLRALVEDQAAGRVGGTTVVFDAAGDALYFSKRVIPFVPQNALAERPGAVHLHAGLYAYRPAALAAYAALPPSPLEELEGLEQLRFLDAGIRVGLAVCPMPAWDLVELNNPGDAPVIEAIMAAHGLE